LAVEHSDFRQPHYAVLVLDLVFRFAAQ
jgi:hypothetical protein